MSRPKIRTALTAIFAVTAMVVATLSWFSVTGMQTMNRNTADIADNWLPSVSIAHRIEAVLLYERLAYAKHILAVNKEEMTKIAKTVEASEAESNLALKEYEPLITADAERVIYTDVVAGFAAYRKLGVDMLELSSDNDKEFAKVVFDKEMGAAAETVTARIKDLVAFNTTGAEAARQSSQATYKFAIVEVIALIAAAGIVILGAVIFALRGIARPIRVITGSMTHLAAGDTETPIPYATRTDEIGEMAGAVEVFRKAAIANKEMEAEAETQRAKSEADRVRLTAQAEASARERLQQATAGLATGLRRLAAGDLSFQISETFAPDFEALRHDLNGAIEQLGETLRSVVGTAGAIDNGTREISQSSDDLSKRTEQQAASLEETAAALDEITANVASASKRADEARNVAVMANKSASQSGTVVANAVDAMEKIAQSSGQISNIIGVIDEIAFQTNLLALNAGVEAARAGDAGKGFAVVAQEVRELAQRSAKAAKEIKELIRNSSTQVTDGVKLVSETGEALKTIETYIVTINQHMDAIATSAREQSVGLAEVNTAVNRMDQVTQQNAAMVEETNAASATLANEASRLRELTSHFTLDAEAQTGMAHGRRRAA